MQDASCRREDIVAAFEDLVHRLHRRQVALWSSYLEATESMSPKEYKTYEAECWSVLRAGIAGIEAEAAVLQQEFERRLTTFDEAGAAA